MWRICWRTKETGESKAGEEGQGPAMFYSQEEAEQATKELEEKYPILEIWVDKVE